MGEEKSWKLDKVLKIDDDQLKTPEHDKLCLWVHKHHKEFMKGCCYELVWERPIMNRGFVVGIPDFSLMVYNDLFHDNYFPIAYIEVKPKIKSLGETLRQLQLYKNTCGRPNIKIILVTKSIEHKEIFESQGFYFVGVTDEMLL